MLHHDEICKQAVEASRSINREAVIAAFVGSLSTRNLPARSAFGSYVVLQHFEAHAFQPSNHFDSVCAYCGMPNVLQSPERAERIQKYPFQIQHTNIQYSAYDLATFNERSIDTPKQQDRMCLKSMVTALQSLPHSAQLGDLRKSLQGSFKGNKFQRMILLETFGYAGILCPRDQEHYSERFITYSGFQNG
jgi:predicted DCC family thiol-disulfide oxidoreductase YuxK